MMKQSIELRSDTFTLPDEEMRRAIYEAEVGNSGYGEDPCVNALEEELADYFGFEGAVFLPSGTMAGQIAIRVWTRQGDIVLIEEHGHEYYFETGSMAAISGAQARLLKGSRGILSTREIARSIVHPENRYARTALLVLENTSNFGGGSVYPRKLLDSIFEMTEKERLPVHVDGARIWNAIVAGKADPHRLVPSSGSLSVCFSKGLGAPMGSLLLGSRDFVAEARRIQCMLGGVMRQVGFMAAAARYGFRHNLERLEEDHRNARMLADLLAENPGLEVTPDQVETNIVYVRIRKGAGAAARLIETLNQRGVRALAVGPLVRLVTHLNVSRRQCREAAALIDELA